MGMAGARALAIAPANNRGSFGCDPSLPSSIEASSNARKQNTIKKRLVLAIVMDFQAAGFRLFTRCQSINAEAITNGVITTACTTKLRP